jgi:hypothetical protein
MVLYTICAERTMEIVNRPRAAGSRHKTSQFCLPLVKMDSTDCEVSKETSDVLSPLHLGFRLLAVAG